MFQSPIQYLLRVSALVPGVEIWVWERIASDPVECQQTCITVAHDHLSQYIDTVVCKVSRQFNKVG